MTFNDPVELLTNEMWINDCDSVACYNWVEAGAFVGHSEGGCAQGQEMYFVHQYAGGVHTDLCLAPVPSGDINQYANVYIFNCSPGQWWCVVVESLTLGSLSVGAGGMPPNAMQPDLQQIGEELTNCTGGTCTNNSAYSDLAYWTNNRYRDNSAQYWAQPHSGVSVTINDPPIAAGWITTPENSSNGGTWYAHTH